MLKGPTMLEFDGIPVCGGSGVGRALLYEETQHVSVTAAVPPKDVEAEVDRLERAAALAKKDLATLHESLASQGAVAEIFTAHAAMLDDFLPKLTQTIRQGFIAEHAVATLLHEAANRLSQVRDPTLSQRAHDIIDIERRLLRALGGLRPEAPEPERGEGPVVVVALDLTPSEAGELQGRNIAAIALERGGHTSHTAVILKSLEIPCVMGVEGLTASVSPGQMIWVEGSRGRVVVEPDSAAMERAIELAQRYERLEAKLLEESHLPAETMDGHRATMLANIEYPLDVDAAMARGAEGVGLFRTEFLYEGSGEQLPSEEEQVSHYRSTLARLDGGYLTIRTFDFGADKESPIVPDEPEPNPALGVRSLRWCFSHEEPFRAQLRAILRVAAEGDVRIMLPMVGSLEELRRAKAIIADVAASLEAEGIAHRGDLPVGIMIEIPAAAVTADLLAAEADFFSIGTNDLIQYNLAVDRMNPRVEPLFRPAHPSMLRLIQTTLEAAKRAGIPVTMCGEMGGDTIYTVLLLGLGLREFSLTPGYIPRVRRLLRSLTLRDARRIAGECLRLPTSEAIERVLRDRITPVGAG